MLRLDPIECLFCFICSQNNHISRITKMVESTEHFVVVKVEGKTARVEALRLDGGTLETTELTR